jgi:hypothetical protein
MVGSFFVVKGRDGGMYMTLKVFRAILDDTAIYNQGGEGDR